MIEVIDIDIEYIKSILDYDPETGFLTWSKTIGPRAKKGGIAGSKHIHGYIQIKINNVKILAHRIAWAMHYGVQPSYELDHINGIKYDNRIINIRECNRSENIINRAMQKNNTSGYRGVMWDSSCNKWRAQIKKNNKRMYIGTYEKIEDAAKAYTEAAKIHHGEFARLV